MSISPAALLRPFADVSRAIRRGPNSFASFDAYAEHLTHTLARAACIIAIAGAVGLWPLDLVFFRGHPEVIRNFAIGRSLSISLLALGFVAVDRLARAGRRTTGAWLATGLAAIALTFHMAARNGAPDEPWIHTALATPIVSVILVVPLRRRIAMTALLAATPLIAYFGTAPGYLDTPFVGALFTLLASAFAVTVTLGHIFFVFVRIAFDHAKELEHANRTDALTHLHARAYTLERASQEIARASRGAGPLSLLVVDVDHFKRINDTHGHAVGDAVLRHTAQAMRASLRSSDLAGRIGGEEFLIVLPAAAPDAAREAAERLRAAVAGSVPPDLPAVTVSVGLASYGGDDEDLPALLQRADAALYQAKREGRDRVRAG